MSNPLDHDPYWLKPEIKPCRLKCIVSYVKYNSIQKNHTCALCGHGPKSKKKQTMSVAFPTGLHVVLYLCNKCALKLTRKGVEAR